MKKNKLLLTIVFILIQYGCGESLYSGAGTTGTLTTTNSAGRSGAYYLPENYQDTALPLLVLYHGTGGDGNDMVSAFKTRC